MTNAKQLFNVTIFSILCSVIVAVPTFAQGTDSSNLKSQGLDELEAFDRHICLHFGQFVVRVDSNRVFCRSVETILGYSTIVDSVTLLTYQNGWYQNVQNTPPSFLILDLKYSVTVLVSEFGFKGVLLMKYLYLPDSIQESTDFYLDGRQFTGWGDNATPRPDLLEEMSDSITLTLDLLEQYPLVRPSF